MLLLVIRGGFKRRQITFMGKSQCFHVQSKWTETTMD